MFVKFRGRGLLSIFTITIITILLSTTYAVSPHSRPCPPVNISDWLSEHELKPRDFQGRVFIVEFWATWCGPCKQVIPHMNELIEKYRSDGVVFISLSQDQKAQDVRDFLKQHKMNSYIAMDAGNSANFGVRYLPQAYVVSHEGQIVWQGHPTDQQFGQAIAFAVNAAPPALLKGIELGPFEEHRFALTGGSGFVNAYKTLKLEARKKDSKNAGLAADLLNKIDSGIAELVENTVKKTKEDKLTAYFELESLASRFRTSNSAGIAKEHYEKMEAEPEIVKHHEAEKLMRSVNRTFDKCIPCKRCYQCSLSCPGCRTLNSDSLRAGTLILRDIVDKYPETTAAQYAGTMLVEFNKYFPATRADANDITVSSTETGTLETTIPVKGD